MEIPTNFEDLDLPLFPTTEEEKEILEDVLEKIDGSGTYFLCILLEEPSSKGERYPNVRDIIKKIHKALCGEYTLNGYLGDKYADGGYFEDIEEKEEVLLRKIWIQKLLDYTGE